MKSFVTLLLVLLVVGCTSQPPEEVETTPVVQQPAEVTYPGDTVIIDSINSLDELAILPVARFSIICDNITQSIEFYEADSVELPDDSTLRKLALVVSHEGDNFTFTTDSTAIKEELSTLVVKRKGKNITVYYNGETQQYTGGKIALEDDKLFIDGKEIAYAGKGDAPGPIKIGIPRITNLAVVGSAQKINCRVTLAQLDVRATGNGTTITCDSVYSLLPVSTKDSVMVTVKYAQQVDNINLNGAGSITLDTDDTISMASITGSGNIYLAKGVIVAKEKTKGEGELVYR